METDEIQIKPEPVNCYELLCDATADMAQLYAHFLTGNLFNDIEGLQCAHSGLEKLNKVLGEYNRIW